MNRLIAVLILPYLTCAAFAGATQAAPQANTSAKASLAPKTSDLQTDDQKTIYALGVWMGQKLSQQMSLFNLSDSEMKLAEMGLSDQLHGRALKADLATFGPKLNELAKTRSEAAAKKQKELSTAFLAKSIKEPGAKKSSSGLLYFSVKEGSGASPKATDTVRVHYTGTFPDGKVFDSSVERGQPAEFPLNGVIPCWTEGVQKMKVGGKAKLICPSDIAYGDQGRPGIPGGATLVFQIELLEIVKAEPKAK